MPSVVQITKTINDSLKLNAAVNTAVNTALNAFQNVDPTDLDTRTLEYVKRIN